MQANKPLIIVHEADTTKGGGPLAELIAECPADLVRLIFRPRGEPLLEEKEMEGGSDAHGDQADGIGAGDGGDGGDGGGGGGGCDSALDGGTEAGTSTSTSTSTLPLSEGGGAIIVPWPRVEALQVESLRMILEEMLVASPRYGAYVEALEHGLGRGSLAAPDPRPDPATSDVRASRRLQEPVRSLDSEGQQGSPLAPRERQTASEGLEDRRSVAGVQGWGARGARRRRFAITHTGLELSMPGHVPSQLEWGFSQREVLFVSPSNPGALEVALQLQRSGLLAAECRVGGRRGLEITSRWRESRRVSQRQLLARHRSSAKNSEATRQWSLITRNVSTRNVSVGPEHSAEVPPPPPSHFRGAGRPPAEPPYREHPDALTSLNNLGAGEAGGEDGGGEAEASTSVSSVGAVPVDTDGDGIADTLLTEQSQAAEAAPTRMLLVLNVHSFVGPCGEQLAREVRPRSTEIDRDRREADRA